MKKSVLIVATLCLTSVGCVKHQEEFSIGPPPKAITFQTAKYRVSRATEEEISGSKFTYDHFVTHAWSDAAVGEGNVFMDHQRIEKTGDGSAWMPTVDYYWPTISTVDFISYYPENTADKTCPTVERNKLTYTGYDVSGDKTDITVATNDLMYAEKAVGYSGNIDRVNDDKGGVNDSGYSGVPTLFHHALAQLEIRLLVKQPAGETESHWEAVIDHAALTGYYTRGSLELALNDPTIEHGIVGWTPIADDPKVGWVHEGNARAQAIVGTDAANPTFTVSSTGTGTDYLTGEQGCRSLFKAFVLPQTLTNAHLFDLKFTLNKYRGNVLELSEADRDIRHIQLKTDAVAYWGMNQRIVYTIVIDPAKAGKLSFDPAVVDWAEVANDKSADDYLTAQNYFELPTADKWEESNVWYAKDSDGNIFAEITKEAVYTTSPMAYYQVVTVYPVKNGKAVLTQGRIVQVLKKQGGEDVSSEPLAGGTVAMRERSEGSDAVSDCVLGTEPNRTSVRMDKEGNLSFGAPGALDSSLSLEPYTVTDGDGNVYPVVKVGAAYWLRENLRATRYTDGTALTKKTSDTEVPSGGFANSVYFHENEPMYIWYSSEDFDVSVQSEEVKRCYGLLYNLRAICGSDDPWIYEPDGSWTGLLQLGDPAIDNPEVAADPNKQLCPEGWHIPTMNVSGFAWDQPDMAYLEENFAFNWDWKIFLTDNMSAAEGTRDLSTAQWAKHSAVKFSNITDLSFNAIPALGQTDEDAFAVVSSNWTVKEDSRMYGGLFLTWTSCLKRSGDYYYPGMLPAICYNANDISGYGLDSYLPFMGRQYLPLRCVRNY